MPKMSNRKKAEFDFFLNKHNRIEYNKKCKQCINNCKQSHKADLITCHRYISKRSNKIA